MSYIVKKTIRELCINSLAKYVGEIVEKESGNIIGEKQHSMVVNRLKKRLIDLGIDSPEEYYNYLQDHYEVESSHLITTLTTHHTFFFREFAHFEFLIRNLSNVVGQVRKRGENKIRILSAACSRGQEVYSVASFLEHHLKEFPGMSYEILGTDIDPQSLKIAKNGVYNFKDVKSIPSIYLQGNWQRGTGDIADFAKIKKHVKKNCKFKVMNLLHLDKELSGKFDVIFCRNVFIYFDNSSIASIVKSIKNYIYPEGYLITGLSESLKMIDVKKNTLAPSVYSFNTDNEKVRTGENLGDKASTSIAQGAYFPDPIKVLSVDDSVVVLKLLTKIFSEDPRFELVGTALNGLEAEEFMKDNSVDAMTLDIHMPKMDGVEYLKKNYRKGHHPHVVMVSSASREDTRYAQEALRSGACDFVEKPALNNLTERAEEIKNKLKMAFLNSAVNVERPVDKSFSKDFRIENLEGKVRILVAGLSDIEKLSYSLRELQGDWPPTFLFLEGNSNVLEIVQSKLPLSVSTSVFESIDTVKKNFVYICDFNNHVDTITSYLNKKRVSAMVYGACTRKVANWLSSLDGSQIMFEELADNINEKYTSIATDIFPYTSFSHISTEFLSKK